MADFTKVDKTIQQVKYQQVRHNTESIMCLTESESGTVAAGKSAITCVRGKTLDTSLVLTALYV